MGSIDEVVELAAYYRPIEGQNVLLRIGISMTKSPTHRADEDASYEELVTIEDVGWQGVGKGASLRSIFLHPDIPLPGNCPNLRCKLNILHSTTSVAMDA